MKVGLPFMKCSLNPSLQKSNTCDLGKAWREMNDQRVGVDKDIDKSFTYKNVWMDGSTKDDVVGSVQKEIDSINSIRKENGKRALRKDAVSVVEFIEKPNIEYMEKLNYEEKVKFLNDSHRVMSDLIYDWNSNWKILESVQHHDEFGGLSAHNHSLVMLTTVDKDGLPNMKAKSEFNSSFFDFVNRHYAEKMRNLGYEVEDAKMFESLTQEEKLERKINPNENGLDSYSFKKKKQKELTENIKDKEIKNEQLAKVLEDKVVQITNAPSLEKYEELKNDNERLKNEVVLKERIIEELKKELLVIKTKMESWKNKFIELSNKAGSKLMAAFGFKESNSIENIMPEASVLKAFNNLNKNCVERDPTKYRVIPDKSNAGKYCVVYRNEKNKVEMIESNLESRNIAMKRIKEMSNVNIQIVGKMKEGIKIE